MKNFVQKGDTINYTNGGSLIASGAVVFFGNIAGIAATDIAANATGALMIEGVFNLAKNTSLAITAGDDLYWSAGSSQITKTATDTPIGIAATTQGSTDTHVDVIINPDRAICKAADVAAVGTANATDLASAEALANANKTAINAILTALKNAGLMA